VTCLTESTLLSITADKFLKFLTIAPELADPFNSLLNHRTANMLKTLEFVKLIKENKPWSKIEFIGTMFNYEQHGAGETIWTSVRARACLHHSPDLVCDFLLSGRAR